jgi:hypothetical protein
LHFPSDHDRRDGLRRGCSVRLATSVVIARIRFELHGTIDHHQHDRFCQPAFHYSRFAGGDQQHTHVHWIIDLSACPAGRRG